MMRETTEGQRAAALPKGMKKAVGLESFVFLAIFLGVFCLIGARMGAANMLQTMMNTAFDLLVNTVLYIMALAVLAGAVSALFAEFGVISLLNKLLSPLMRPLYGLPGASVLGIVTTYLSDNPAVLTLADDAGFRRYFKKYQLPALTNLGTAFGMGLIITTYMLGVRAPDGESFLGPALLGNLGAVIGSIVSTRLMIRHTKKLYGLDAPCDGEAGELEDMSVRRVREGSVGSRFIDALLTGGQSGVQMGVAIIPGVLIICTMVMMLTYGPGTGGYTGAAYEGVAVLLLTDGMSLAQQRNAVKEAAARLSGAQENAVQQRDEVIPPEAETRQRTVSAPMRAEDNIRLAQRAAASLGENGAKAFRAAYDTATAETLDPAEAFRGFAQVYNAALRGEEYTAEDLPAHMAAAAQASGANDRAAAAQAKYFKDAGLVRDDYTRRANLSSKTQNTLDALGKTLGVRIRFVEQVDGGRANGSYSNGEITVALDADDPYSVVVSHETVHRIREAAPDAYQRLENYVREHLGSEALNASAIRRGDRLYRSTDLDAMTEETVADAFARILGEKDGLHDLVQADRTLGQKLRDVIHDILVKIREILNKGSKAQLTEKQKAEFRALEQDLEGMEKVLAGAIEEVGANKNTAQEGGGKRYSIKEIVGDDSKSYGVGVYLDSALLENLTSKERTQMVKERIKELGGEIFTAYDDAGNAVDISVAKPGARFKNRNGRMVPVNKDLTMKYIGNETKQEAVVLLDELIETASFDESRASLYSHGWLDNNGKNNWDYWATYIQDKNGTIWRATLNLANTVDGEKILYDINPIKKVGQSVKSDTSLPQTSVAQNIENVNRKFSLKEYTDEERRQHVKDAVDYFGSTSSWNGREAAGFLRQARGRPGRLPHCGPPGHCRCPGRRLRRGGSLRGHGAVHGRGEYPYQPGERGDQPLRHAHQGADGYSVRLYQPGTRRGPSGPGQCGRAHGLQHGISCRDQGRQDPGRYQGVL